MQEQIKINEEKLQEFYDGVYRDGDIRDNEKLYHWIIKLISPQQEKKFLDVACGGGWMLRAAEKKNLKTYGIDISSNAVKKAKNNAPNTEVVVGSGEKLPWPDEYFDYVTCLGSLEHYIRPEIGAREISRVLKKDGLSVIMFPNKYPFGEVIQALFKGDSSEPWQILERQTSREGWRRFLEENGLKVEKVLKYNKYPEFFKPGTWKIKSLRKFIIVSFLRYLTPFNFALQFVYLCKK